jgi:hypothetical protein
MYITANFRTDAFFSPNNQYYRPLTAPLMNYGLLTAVCLPLLGLNRLPYRGLTAGFSILNDLCAGLPIGRGKVNLYCYRYFLPPWWCVRNRAGVGKILGKFSLNNSRNRRGKKSSIVHSSIVLL